MSPLQTLSQEVNKRINCCKNCDGAGLQPWVHPTYRTSATKDMCKPCKGKGYVIPLEEGCEVIVDDYNYSVISRQLAENVFCLSEDKEHTRYFDEEDLENLGKPLTLQDILLVLSKIGYRFKDDELDGVNILDDTYDELYLFTIDLTKDPQEWENKTIEAITKLIK